MEVNPCSNFLYIVDTRPKINAMANRAGGKGYESEAFYPNTKFVFKGIENIHIMRESLRWYLLLQKELLYIEPLILQQTHRDL